MNTLLPAYLESLRPILYIEDSDFSFVEQQINEVADGADIFEFNNGYGALDFKTKRVLQKGEPSLSSFLSIHKDSGFDKRVFLILKDIHKSLEDPKIIAQLRYIADRAMSVEGYHTTIFILSGIRIIPRELEQLITFVSSEHPAQKHIETIILEYARHLGFSFSSDEEIGALALELKGLSEFQIRQTLNLAYCRGGYISFEKDRKLILQEKKQMVEKSGMLEFVESGDTLDIVGGLGSLKSWLRDRAQIFNQLDKALKNGVDRPKGVLILGMPGCGKSLTAKTTATLFSVPLVRLDVGRLLGKYVGESERNMRTALAVSESISPCVLWIDEIEKAFAGSGSGQGHEVTMRLIGQFLTWMQEKKNTVFVVATANNITELPPEFLRKGRFDDIFAVELPTLEERLEIIQIHLKKRGHYHKNIELALVAKQTAEFSGADLERLVGSAVEYIFIHKISEISTENLIAAAKKITPLSKAMQSVFEKQKKQLQAYSIQSACGEMGGDTVIESRGKLAYPLTRVFLHKSENEVNSKKNHLLEPRLSDR